MSEAYQDLLSGHTRKPLEFRVLLAHNEERWLRVKPLLLEENGQRAIAGLAGVHARSLYRVLRACASIGVFTEDHQKRFSLTP